MCEHFGGTPLFTQVSYGDSCCGSLMRMGGGARTLRLLGVSASAPRVGMERLCQGVSGLASDYGYGVDMWPCHLACLACEVHRRGAYGSRGVKRRAGF